MRSQDKYNKEKTSLINIRFVKSTEADILEYLEQQPNKSGYIKSLIRADMVKGRKENSK